MRLFSKDADAARPTGTLGRPAAAWQADVEPERWQILFADGTEPPHSSELNQEKRDGTFVCAACFQPLFTSRTKYESGTGWPSFFEPLPGALETREDRKFFMLRVEYHCARCGGHQGHVFDDGPAPTGQRYCNNGLALRFIADGEPIPPARGG